ncbi:polygalacturonate 4-alpha-galacturonosyltransferase-like [Lactuca sativa]|uniref:polygalacturonate 4-alpha-galacturonosyltransferase-like n=1 Tax=Lactuca sativa TaxID=4236 RepID=UPI0022AFC9AF|nr:polygalacturonate 4-alpha-galacturonosyltransferase-like [Lactuca sativa]
MSSFSLLTLFNLRHSKHQFPDVVATSTLLMPSLPLLVLLYHPASTLSRNEKLVVTVSEIGGGGGLLLNIPDYVFFSFSFFLIEDGDQEGVSSFGVHRNRGGGGSRFPVFTLLLILVLAPMVFFVGREIYSADSIDQNDSSIKMHDVDWRTKLALQHIKSLLSTEVIDFIKANRDDLGPLSLDSFRKQNFSASWKFSGQENVIDISLSSSDIMWQLITKKTPKGKQDNDHSQYVETPTKLARRKPRDKRRETRATGLMKEDEDVSIKLENAAIEKSKSVDSTVLGKYSIWRKEVDNKNIDTPVCLIRDQIIMARVYLSIATMKNKTNMAHELQIRLKESQRALGGATTDIDLNQSAPEKIKDMGQLLSKARDQLYYCKLLIGKLRAMLQSADEQVRSLKKQSTFLSQLAAKTIPNGIHCLSMRLKIEYYLLSPEKRNFPRIQNLKNPSLYHYALFFDNVLVASVVVKSTIMNAKSNGSLKKLKLYQLFDELQGHESNVAQTLREFSGGPIALVSSFDPHVSNPSASDPFKSVIPTIPPIQPSPPTLPASASSNYQFDGDLDPEAMDSELRFQQEFSLLSMKYKRPFNPLTNYITIVSNILIKVIPNDFPNLRKIHLLINTHLYTKSYLGIP